MKTCAWQLNDWGKGCHITNCGHLCQFTIGGLKANKVKYCQYCGKKIKEYDEIKSSKKERV